jgi:hypothetical protein
MTESAKQKLANELADKAKNYKTELDLERLHQLLQVVNLIRDYPKQAALAGAANRELDAMNAKQAEQDAKDAVDLKKKIAEAHAADTEEAAGNGPVRSAPPRPPTSPSLADSRR